MKAKHEFCDINQLAEQFILQFGVESHKDLKRVGEFQSLEDESLKRKIYDRTRYKLQKETLKLAPEILTIETRSEKVQSRHLKLLDKRIRILKLFLLAFIFTFLATESFKFYEQFEVLPIFKYSIPLIIELSIFLLNLKNSVTAKVLLIGLVVFNAGTFTYKTIENDKNLKHIQMSAVSKKKFIEKEIFKIESQIKVDEFDLKLMKGKFEELVSKNYFKAANATYGTLIAVKTKDLNYLRDQSGKTRLELLKTGEINPRGNSVSIDTIFMIALKVILQIVFLYLIIDLKNIYF